jgi:outer membrane protein assembly factor BamB
MLRWLGILSLAVSVSSCGWVTDYLRGEDNSMPAAPLTEVDNEFAPKMLWKASVGDGEDGEYLKLTPALHDAKVFAADRKGLVAAFEAQTGKRLWAVKTDAPISGGPGAGDGLVLVGTSDATVIALHAADGSIAWTGSVSSEVLSVPAIGEGVVAVHTIDGRIFGLSAADGTKLWTYDRNAPVLTLRGNSSPLIVQGAAICGFDTGKLVALKLTDGTQLWEAGVAMPTGRSELDRIVDIDADPKVSGNTLYVTTFQGRVAAVELFSGRALWVRDMSSYAGLGLGEDKLYVTDEQSRVWALEQSGGGALWKQDKLNGRRLTAPAVIGRSVVVGDFEGYLHWLSDADGHIQARVRHDNDGIDAAPLVINDYLFVLGRGGTLAAYQLQ